MGGTKKMKINPGDCRQFGFRIEKVLFEKIEAIAKVNRRSVSAQMLVFIEDGIDAVGTKFE